MSATPPGGGLGGRELPQGVDPLTPGCEKVNQKSFFKSAENRGASSLWVGDHRYTSSACASKRL